MADERESEALIKAILDDVDAPEYLITNAHAEEWREHLRKHLCRRVDRMEDAHKRLLDLVEAWESEASKLTWPEDGRIVGETLHSCASEVRAILSIIPPTTKEI